MEIASENQETGGFFCRGCFWFKTMWENMVASKVVEASRNMRNLAQEDPRRIIHSVKVGLAIAMVSLIYYFDPIYEGFGVSAMWAVITVVVVFEFSVGATIGRGVNRGIATLLGGVLGVMAHRFASFSGIEILEPIMLASSIFLFSGFVTFVRFFPKLKSRYDYGLLIFILTFSLISVSAYRDDEVIDVAITRLSTICLGGAATMSVCVLLFPVWAGQDLHNLAADNIEKLSNFLEGFGDEYFKALGDENSKDNKALLEDYKTVVNSKTIEDSLVNSAKWEPRHGKFRYRHPWGQYQKIGGLTRECAYRVDSLNSYLKAEMKASPEILVKFQEPCKTMSSETGHVLKKLALAARTMTINSSTLKSHIANAKTAADELKLLLKTNPWQPNDILDIIPVASVASLLGEVVSCTVKITDSVHVLASLAKFKILDDASKSDDEQIVNMRAVSSPSIEASHGIAISAE